MGCGREYSRRDPAQGQKSKIKKEKCTKIDRRDLQTFACGKSLIKNTDRHTSLLT